MSRGPLHIEIELDHVEDPIGGHVLNDAAPVPFSGWLGLIAALEIALRASADTGGGD